MQIGRWNHMGKNGSAPTGAGQFDFDAFAKKQDKKYGGGHGGSSRPSSGASRSTGGRPSYSGSRAPAGRGGPRSGNSFGSRGGSRGGSSRGRGFGSFGENEYEIAKFVNRAEAVTVEEPAFVPEHAFSDFAVDERLKKNISNKGYVTPTPIQDKTIPHILMGQDVVGLAETGTGKTAAFLVPLIDKVLKNPQERILVMAPTRELAVQTEQELAGFAKGLGFSGMIAVGGANIGPQISALRHHPAFVIGTPGRLKDLMERRALDLSSFGTVVLDEADRMLDMGFIDDMRFILAKMLPDRHTLFFSATMGKDIEGLIGDFLKQPVIISVKKRDTSKNVDQDVIRVGHGQDKFDMLVNMLKQPDFHKVLIFVRTKHGAEKLAKSLSHEHIHSESIHGNKTHNARMRALEVFKRGKVQALVATDVAARGLDIPLVSHVINYDLPSTYEDYVHRIGRTGRADAKGMALTFVRG